MNRILSFFIVTILVFTSVVSYAAFPSQTTPQPVYQNEAPVATDAIKVTPAPAPATGSLSNNEIGLVIGILSLVFGIISVAASPVAAMIFAAAAIVLGLMGMERPWRGLSLAGVILGIIGGAVGLVRLIVG